MYISTLIHSGECFATIISFPINIGSSLQNHSISIRLADNNGLDFANLFIISIQFFIALSIELVLQFDPSVAFVNRTIEVLVNSQCEDDFGIGLTPYQLIDFGVYDCELVANISLTCRYCLVGL